MRRPTRNEATVAAMGVAVVLAVACSKVLGIEPAHERVEVENDGGPIIDSTAPAEDGSLPPLGDKDAACGDTTSDPKNCGACGLDCRGSKCTSGRCEPSVFVFGLSRPYALAVTDEAVYWSDGAAAGSAGGVRRCDLAGCQNGMPRTLFEKPGVNYANVVVDGDNVLALRSVVPRAIDVCNRLGCSNSPYSISVPAADSIAVSSQKLHFTTGPTPSSSTAPDAGTWRCNDLPYCFQKTQLLTKGTAVRAVDADLYVIDRGATQINDGVLLRCASGNCSSPKTLASSIAYGYSRFVASKYGVGWIAQNGADIQLFMCEPQSCAGGPKALAKILGYVENFAWDSKYLYWTNSEYSAIERVAWASTTNPKPEVVLTKQGLPNGIAMQDGALYFTRMEFGDIVRWVPPP
jgi:hypothetical protein